MSLTSYRAAPPRARPARRGWRAQLPSVRVASCFRDGRPPRLPLPFRAGSGTPVGPGGDPLSRVLGRSTMGAAGFHGRVRDGIGWGTRAVAAGSGGRPGWGEGLGWLARAWGMRCARPAAGLPPGRGSSLGRLGPVGCARRRACTPGLSTWWSATALLARPGLAVGFPLRCLQRLSRPRLATRLRGWRHDRSTRGASAPVLSY